MIWDLRRGDADDDRLSPEGRGFRAIILSALFEFNIVQAAAAFLFLILLPAILVGLAPSTLHTFGSAFASTAAQVWDHPFLAIAALVILGLAGYWFGPAILRGAARNLFHLHYTLVFPVFILGREMIKVFAERWFGAVDTPVKLYRRRVVGTVIAAAFFTGSALLIAFFLLRTYGIQTVSLVSGDWRAILRTAIVNGTEILSISTAIACVYWSWRELTLGAPTIDWTQQDKTPGAQSFHIAHVSDPHLVGERYGYRMESGSHGPRGNGRWLAALERLSELDANRRFDWIFVTGDVTDTGRRAEWAEFIDSVEPYPALRERMFIVPGNHDVNVADRENPAQLELPWSPGMALRKFRFICAADWLQGDRVHVFDREAGKLGSTLHDFLRAEGRLEHFRALAQRGSLYEAAWTSRIWPELFPMIVPPGADGRPGVVLLNSSTNSHTAVTNAIGTVEPEELRALEKVLEGEGAAWLILLHHQVVEYPILGISLQERVALALTNAPELVGAIGKGARRAAIFHGHRHRDWIGSCGELALCSAASATLGAHGDATGLGVFHFYDVAVDDRRNVKIVHSERVTVADCEAAPRQRPLGHLSRV